MFKNDQVPDLNVDLRTHPFRSALKVRRVFGGPPKTIGEKKKGAASDADDW